jgi:hypothetical protein
MRKAFHIILGNLEMRDFQNRESRLVNMAHIPISLEGFLNFMTRRVVAKKRQVYEFSSFINDLLSDLVMKNLSTKCFGGLLASPVRTAISMLEIPSESGAEPIAGIGDRVTLQTTTGLGGTGAPIEGGTSPIWQAAANNYCVFRPSAIGKGSPPFFVNTMPPMVQGGKSLKKTFDYLVINSASTKPKLYGVWDREEFFNKNGADPIDPIDDKTRGIPHYTFGQTAGILKTVSFSKTDQEFLPEAKYEQEGSNAINQLAAVYDVTFEMLGTSRFQPGEYIYFDPVTMGVGKPYENATKYSDRSIANLMGLGGYHLVIEVSSNIQRGEFVTTLKTRWTTSGCHPISGCSN